MWGWLLGRVDFQCWVLGMEKVEKGKRPEAGEYVCRERMEDIVCLKKEMGLREEEEREFDESVLLCLH